MKTVGIFDAKRDLSQLLDAVEKGQAVVITRQGRPVARLKPVEASGQVAKVQPESGHARRVRSQAEKERILAEARDFRKRHPLRGVTLRELIDDRRHR